MKKKTLVVGGAGYIGGCVTDELLKQKIPFTVYDNLTYENHYLKAVDFVFGDVRDYTKLRKLIQDYSHIIWLAAIVGDGACAIKPDLTKAINQDAVAWLSHHFSGRILFTSTCSVYGLNNEAVSEESITNPLSVYAQTKLAAESYLKTKDSLIFRLGTAYGLGDAFSRIRMDLAVNYMTMNAIKNKSLTVYGGAQWRPFMHVKDIGKVIINNLYTDSKGIYNIATENLTIINVAKNIHTVTGCEIKIAKQKFEDNRNYNANISKALTDRVLSIEGHRRIIDGIKEVKELVLSNRVKNISLEFYSNERYLLSRIIELEGSHK